MNSKGGVFSPNDQLMIRVPDEAGPRRGNFHRRSSTHAWSALVSKLLLITASQLS
jgi:hypothetical protein